MEGAQSAELMNKVIQDVLAIDNQLYESKGEVRVLTDVSKMGELDMSARLSAIRAMKLVSFDKIAIVGVSAGNRKVIDLITSMTGVGSRFGFFDKREDAESWLAN